MKEIKKQSYIMEYLEDYIVNKEKLWKFIPVSWNWYITVDECWDERLNVLISKELKGKIVKEYNIKDESSIFYNLYSEDVVKLLFEYLNKY